MKYGLYLPNFGAFGDPATLVEFAVAAEAAGWDGFFIWDHVAGYDARFTDPWVGLAAVAQATERIRIGTTVTPLPRRRPQKVARETASLDRLSNGRLTLGVGIGEIPIEYDGMGEVADLKIRGDMLDEALEVISGLWSGELFAHRGEHYRVDEVRFLPTPVQEPSIPVWVAAIWPHKRPLRRAARWNGVFPLFLGMRHPERTQGELRQCIDYIRAHRESSAPFDIVHAGISPAGDAARAREIVAPYADVGVTWWLESIAPYRDGKGFEEPWDTAPLRERVRAGPPRID